MDRQVVPVVHATGWRRGERELCGKRMLTEMELVLCWPRVAVWLCNKAFARMLDVSGRREELLMMQ